MERWFGEGLVVGECENGARRGVGGVFRVRVVWLGGLGEKGLVGVFRGGFGEGRGEWVWEG